MPRHRARWVRQEVVDKVYNLLLKNDTVGAIAEIEAYRDEERFQRTEMEASDRLGRMPWKGAKDA